MSDKLRREITVELEMLDELLNTSRPIVEHALVQEEPSQVEVLALASILHSFYSGLENAFKRITKAVSVPGLEGHDWHQRVLEQMRADRLGVLSVDLISQLDEFSSSAISSVTVTLTD